MVSPFPQSTVGRNVLSSLLWLDAGVGSTLAVTSFSANADLTESLFVIFAVCVVSTLIAFAYFAIRKPEYLLTEPAQIQSRIADKVFGQGNQITSDPVKIIDAIRKDPASAAPSMNTRRAIGTTTYEEGSGGQA